LLKLAVRLLGQINGNLLKDLLPGNPAGLVIDGKAIEISGLVLARFDVHSALHGPASHDPKAELFVLPKQCHCRHWKPTAWSHDRIVANSRHVSITG
jgi:hypothetical protein